MTPHHTNPEESQSKKTPSGQSSDLRASSIGAVELSDKERLELRLRDFLSSKRAVVTPFIPEAASTDATQLFDLAYLTVLYNGKWLYGEKQQISLTPRPLFEGVTSDGRTMVVLELSHESWGLIAPDSREVLSASALPGQPRGLKWPLFEPFHGSGFIVLEAPRAPSDDITVQYILSDQSRTEALEHGYEVHGAISSGRLPKNAGVTTYVPVPSFLFQQAFTLGRERAESDHGVIIQDLAKPLVLGILDFRFNKTGEFTLSLLVRHLHADSPQRAIFYDEQLEGKIVFNPLCGTFSTTYSTEIRKTETSPPLA